MAFTRPKRRKGAGKNFNKGRRGGKKGNYSKPGVKVICSDCGKSCDVPFKPTAGKPVFCKRCFGKQGQNHKEVVASLPEQLAEINRKLDIILQAIEYED